MKTAAVFRLFRSFNEKADCAKADIFLAICSLMAKPFSSGGAVS